MIVICQKPIKQTFTLLLFIYYLIILKKKSRIMPDMGKLHLPIYHAIFLLECIFSVEL
ncbi:hypothetical protein SAMN03080617_02002 [Algoriphagus alkaliphilus]|uniref:Uncharacterized protein n=1 Tax=Algoriphagus alkaliphilus TaxID=279824 RepID=A0A1G5XUQ4_9BACT|nr:hypothetical protein SAMN03080617_02002 [Algoriphagus alkaliphilus]